MHRAFSNQQERILALIRQGETPVSDFRVGLEIEHIIVDAKTLKSVDYYQANGVEEILRRMLSGRHEAILENGRLVGLRNPGYLITLEPGGQLEISIRPCKRLAEAYDIYWEFLEQILPILEENRQWMLCIGYHPRSSIHEIPFNPKQRYRHMAEYLQKTGRFAHCMMKGTASLQVVIDYQHQTDFIEKLRVAHFLMPFLALVSDNAPYFEGKPVERFSVRSAIWDETDPARCALIPGVMDQEFGYRAYADYILRTPPILMQKNHQFVETGLLRTEELEGLEQFSDDEVDHLLSMVFPDIRVRRYIEIRMADSLPLPLSFAFAALVKNLFYCETALGYLYHLSQGMSDEKMLQLRKDMQAYGFDARFGGTTCQQMLLTLMDLAKQNSIPQEKNWLCHLETLILAKETPAMVSRRLVRATGMKALEWCAAHSWKKEAM